MKHTLVFLSGTLLTSILADAADPTLLFYAPFDSNTTAVVAGGNPKPLRSAVTNEPGKAGMSVRTLKTYQALSYDGRGNIDLNRGTMAFFFKPNFDVVEEEWSPILSVETEIEGYWNSVNDLIVIDKTLYSQFFDIGRYTRRLPVGAPVVGRWKKGEWVHLALTWDREQGVRVYENGEEKSSSWGNHHWYWNQVPSVINLNGGYYSTQDANWDDFRIYSCVLPQQAIAALARGEAPKYEPVPLVAPDVHEKLSREKFGWTADDLKQLPVAGSTPMEFKWAHIDHTEDCKRRMAQPFEGLPSTCWPHARYGASIAGKQLEIYLDQGAAYDRVRLFAQRPFHGGLMQPQPVGDPKQIVEVNAERPISRACLTDGGASVPLAAFGQEHDRKRDARATMQTPLLLLQRKDGWIGQIDFYQANEVKSSPKVSKTYTGAEPIARIPDTQAGLAIKSWLSPGEQRCVSMITGEPRKQFTIKSPAFEGIQMLTEPISTNNTPLDGVVVKFVARKISSDTPLTVKVREPIWPQREWCNADVLVKAGAREITLVLRPRPLLTKKGEPLAVEVVAGAPVEWVLGKGGCSIGLIEGNREKILPIHVHDEMEFTREAFSEINEGHVFDYLANNRDMWERLSRPAEALNEIVPNDPILMQLKHRLGWEKQRVPYPTPANPSNAPEWALWERETLQLVKQLIDWIIDNRQVWNGEFGGVWGDDTDMTENWMGIWLASDDDNKIKNSMRLLMDGLWKYNLDEGVSASVRDALHSYEEGQGTISQRILMDYGNPTAVERVMTACTHYDLWMKKAPDGKYDFVSWNMGAKEVWNYGNFAGDKSVTGLMFIQACYLLWYNHHPAVQPYLLNWRRLHEYFGGMPVDAAYELTRDPELYKKYEHLVSGAEMRYLSSVNDALAAVPLPADTKPLLHAAQASRGLESVSTNFPTTLWGIGSMHVPTEAVYLAWKATDDKKYLVDGFQMVCQHLNEQMWLYTAALPSTDRCPPPARTLVRCMLGAIPTDRGGDHNVWPRHALSYERGTEDFAALVTENTEKNIKALFYAFDDKDHPLRMRVWRLPPGEYKLGLYEDPEGDGKPNAAIKEWIARLERFSPVDIVLPPHKQVLFTVDPIKTEPMNYDKPDVAIGPEDVYLEAASGHLHAIIHNIGIRPVDNILVQAVDVDTGVIVDTATLAHLDAPLDLKAKKQSVEFHNLDCRVHKTVEVIIDPEGKIDELTKFNNRVVYKF